MSLVTGVRYRLTSSWNPNRLTRRVLLPLAGAVALAVPAQALEFVGSSANPGKTIVRWTLGGDFPLIDPIGLNATIRLFPNATDVLGGTDSAAIIDGEAYALAKFEIPTPLSGMGIRPFVGPYLGARYMGVPKFQFSGSGTLGYNQFAGPSYGLRAIVKLPLDLTFHAYAGASTLVWGTWGSTGLDGQSSGGSVNTAGATMPVVGATVNWSPLNIFTVYAGAETSQLPVDLRGTSGLLGPDKVTVSGVSIGLRFLFFSI
ncbi:MAG: hypothetical protein H7338_09760 [Candidatus Sericytochromatia bacterium]|nr:hypothetical protein [Candidatus Sericytochromatia bacterium]